MLARITGTLVELVGNQALVEPEGTSGLAYEVLVPAYLADALAGRGGQGGGAVGKVVTLFTLQYLESQGQGASFLPRLLGFGSTQERAFFDLLTSVKGLGNKRALRAMALEPGAIARAIAERDARALQRLPEIGPKLADLIVHELKGKVDSFIGTGDSSAAAPMVETKPKKRSATTPTNGSSAQSAAGGSGVANGPTPPVRSTVDALVALGESPVDAERMVARAVDRARSAGDVPETTAELLALAYASR